MSQTRRRQGVAKLSLCLAFIIGSAFSIVNRRLGGLWRHFWRPWTKKERVVVKSGPWPALKRCHVHALPILVTAVLAALNLRGYFIGFVYLGKGDSLAQSFYSLLLQMTAKLFELSIVASLGVIIWDVLRHELLFGADGLPVGLLSAPWRFREVSFWASPELWLGRKGIKGLRKSCLITLLLFTCTMLALFSGPSSAILMIPQWTTSWPCGGATFHLVGDNNTLWPQELATDTSCIRDQVYDDSKAILGLINDTCPSSSTSAIAQALQGRLFEEAYYYIDVTDGLVHRRITVNLPRMPENDETWAITPQLAPCIVSRLLSDTWRTRAILSGVTDRTLSTYRNYKWRDKRLTTVTMESQIPMVRASCKSWHFNPDEPLDPMPIYRNQPLVGAPSIDPVIITPSQAIPFKAYRNISRIAMRWADVAFNEGLDAFPEDKEVNRLSSDYLNVQFPSQNIPGQNKSELLVTCSVDARWIEGRVVGSGIAQSSGSGYYNASVVSDGLEWLGTASEFPALSSTSWRTVRLGVDWLETLTPRLDSSHEGYTTLSSLLETIGIDNSTGDVATLYQTRTAVEAAVAALVANAMAHSGYLENGGAAGSINEVRSFIPIPWADEDILDLFSGTLKIPAPGMTNSSSLNTTTMHWNLWIAGLVYSANGTGYWLSLTVVLVYVLMALLHTAYALWLRKTSGAWESFCDSFTLALGSTPTTELSAISSGITAPECLQKGLMVREFQSSTGGPTTGFISSLLGYTESVQHAKRYNWTRNISSARLDGIRDCHPGIKSWQPLGQGFSTF